MRTSQRCLLVVLALGLAACDPIYGVRRQARISALPPLPLVSEIISNTPGVEHIQYQLWSGDLSHPVHSFIYTGGSNVHGVVQFFVDDKGGIRLEQTLLKIGSPPPQPWVDATRPVMLRLEGLLQEKGGLTGLQTSVVETCRGVACP